MEKLDEERLSENTQLIVKEADSIQVYDSATLSHATDYVKSLNGTIKSIKDYWADPKASAYKAYKSITSRESDMIKPLEGAVSKVKSSISDYVICQEDDKRKAEEAAAKAENEYGVRPAVEANVEKVEGISYQDYYDLKSIDINLLPKFINGIQLVQPDESAIRKVITDAKGSIEIAGVRFEKRKIVKAR